MASVSAISLRFESSFKLSSRTSQASCTTSSLSAFSVGWTRRFVPSLRSFGFRICAARPETVQKVCEINVRRQLALPAESELTPETKFSALGADSLDTVEIVMGLEEEFDISVEEENSKNITTVQEAANLIEKLVHKKGGAN